MRRLIVVLHDWQNQSAAPHLAEAPSRSDLLPPPDGFLCDPNQFEWSKRDNLEHCLIDTFRVGFSIVKSYPIKIVSRQMFCEPFEVGNCMCASLVCAKSSPNVRSGRRSRVALTSTAQFQWLIQEHLGRRQLFAPTSAGWPRNARHSSRSSCSST